MASIDRGALGMKLAYSRRALSDLNGIATYK
jgi:plasmid stabilization system protein ParE